MAETKKDALAAFDVFVETWGVKYDKAVECLVNCKGADAERVEEIRNRTEANRFEIKTQLALCTRRTEHRKEVNGAQHP